ncbi:hypothetical protein M885DRAFT_513555 [Pelagophyceae sp. CCMP2097]|nr:hypothetical protein M885DRAFT_513555 [Pelagophyceae sp. CCMP2097]
MVSDGLAPPSKRRKSEEAVAAVEALAAAAVEALHASLVSDALSVSAVSAISAVSDSVNDSVDEAADEAAVSGDAAVSCEAFVSGNAAVSEAPPAARTALVLGVVDVTDSQAAKLARDEPPWRDFRRLRQLEALGFRVFTASSGNEDLETRSSHFCHEYSTRGGKSLLRDLVLAGATLDVIYLDYFRFPSDYMRQAYQHMPLFLSSLAVVCAPTARVVVPVLRCGGPPCLYWAAAAPLQASDVPLSQATAALDRQADLGGYTNSEQLLHLRLHTPFDALPLPDPLARMLSYKEVSYNEAAVEAH